MYYQHLADSELGFDPFIAPDDFNEKDPNQYGGNHPVNIYEIFKREYALNSHARYIYYYSPGDYPLTLTPTATEYYRYGYTTGGTEVIVDVPLNGSPVTIWGNGITTPVNTSGLDESTGVTKRWVVVCRPSMAKFSLTLAIARAEWLYCGNEINEIKGGTAGMQLKYIHCANINSITGNFAGAWSGGVMLAGRLYAPETLIQGLWNGAFTGTNISSVNLPRTKNIPIYHGTNQDEYPAVTFKILAVVEFNFGASTYLGRYVNERNAYTNLSRISVSPENTSYASFNNCDIIYNKALTEIVWIAPKTVRGLHIPDELPQSQLGVDATTGIMTKLSTNVMQGYSLHIGTQITDLTNLYLSKKSFTTITVGAGSIAFVVDNNILFNADKTTLVKACTASTGSVIIPTTVTSVSPNAFLRYTHTGSIPLIFSGAGQFNLSNYSDFTFATFTGQSLSDIITNDKLVNGTIGSQKYFIINQASLDALNAYNSNAVSVAAGRYINISTLPQGAVLHLDASNAASYPGSGTTWTDLSGNGNNGTLVNGVAYSGGVMSFDGVNDYVSIPILDFDRLSPFSFSIFSNQTTNTLNIFISNQFDDTYKGYMFSASAGSTGMCKYQLMHRSTTSNRIIATTQNEYPINTWRSIIATYDGSSYASGISIYINGVSVPLTIDSDTLTTTTITNANTRIGMRVPPSSGNISGLLNDILIYPKTITSSEALSIYNSQKSKYGL